MSKLLDLCFMEQTAKEAMTGPFFVCDRSIHGCDVEDKNGTHIAFFHAKCNADFFAAVTPQHVLCMIETIRELRAEVEQLEREADMLAEELSKHECVMDRDCPYDHRKRDVACIACFRKAAKRWANHD